MRREPARSRAVIGIGTFVVALLSTSVGAREGFAAPPPVATEPVAPPSAVPNLKVWIEPSVSDAESIRKWIEDQARMVLSQRSRPLDAEGLIHVALRGGPYEYRVHIALLRRRRLLEEQPEVIVCDCKTDDMLVKVAEALAAGAEALERAAEAERVAREEVERPWEDDVGVPERPARWRPSRMGVGGIVTAALGGAVLGGGVVMMAVEPQPIRGRSSMQRDWRPPGIAAVVVGSTAVVTGLSLLVADVVRCRKAAAPSGCTRDRGTSGRLSLVPLITAHGGALGLSKRF